MKKITILLSALLAVTLCSCSYVDKVKDSIMDKIMGKIMSSTTETTMEAIPVETEAAPSVMTDLLNEILQACQYGTPEEFDAALSKLEGIPTDYNYTDTELMLFDEIALCMSQQITTIPEEAPEEEELIDVLAVTDNNEVAQTESSYSYDNHYNDSYNDYEAVSDMEEDEEQEVHIVVDKMPEFPGGSAAMNRWLAKNIKYPLEAMEAGIQGRIICQFVVNKDGSIVDVQVVRGVEETLDAEAVRVIQSMPSWTPGKQDGKNVRVKYTLPIRFKL